MISSTTRILRPAVTARAFVRDISIQPQQHKSSNYYRLLHSAYRSYSSTTHSGNSDNKPTQLVINAVGTDRLGIVHEMTKEVIDAGGNVGASQAAKLGKYFSLMMLVQVPSKEVQPLIQSLENLDDLSASVCVTDEKDGVDTTFASSSSFTIGYKGQLSLKGADNPGIVHKVTKILSTNGLNIDSMETTDELAPGGSTVLFRMKGIAHAYEPLSAGFDVSKIKEELSELGDDLNCDIVLKDL